MIEIKRIKKSELVEVCSLLYKTHVEQVDWQFSPNNPSQLRVEVKKNKKILIDRFTNNAIWFGAFDNNKLVGCTRLTFPDENNKFEMEGYENSSVIQDFFPVDKSGCAESTRTAILKSHNGQGIARQLLLAAFKYCEQNKLSICATVSNSYLISLLKNLGFPMKMEQAFKYEEQDPVPVNFYLADYAKGEVKHLVTELESYKNKLHPTKYSIFQALEMVAEILPTPVYWHDTKGVVLGLNAHCLKGMGATREVIGKVPYDFYPKEIADQILKHHEQVMKTGEILSQDERIEDITTGEVKIFRNTKAPLYDDDGKIIGVIGSAIDVTAEKEAEKLRVDNLEKQVLIDGTNKLRNFLDDLNNLTQSYKFGALNELMGSSNTQNDTPKPDIKLTERESGILYYLSLNKSPKDVAKIISVLEDKKILDSTVNAIINKQLYKKFDVYNVGQLVEKASVLKLLPFLPYG